MGYICPYKFFNSGYGNNIRQMISEKAGINKILHFGVNQIFVNATTYTCLLFLQKQQGNTFKYFEFKDEVDNIEGQLSSNAISYFDVSSENAGKDNWIFTDDQTKNSLILLKRGKPTLEEITTNIFQGPIAGADPVFILKLIEERKDIMRLYSKSLEQEVEIEKEILKPYIKGKQIRKNTINDPIAYAIFPYHNGELLPIIEIMNKYPNAYSYLNTKINKSILLARENGRFKNIWWSYSRPQSLQIVFERKIITPYNAFSASFALDERCDFIFSAGVAGAYGILLKDDVGISYEYLLGLLNSKLIDNYVKAISTALRGGFYSYENKYIKQIPIYIPNDKEKEKHLICNEIEKYQKQIITLKSDRLADKKFLEDKIDGLVGKLYD